MTPSSFHDVAETAPCACGSRQAFGECCIPKLEALAEGTSSQAASAGPALEEVGAEVEWKHDLGATRLPFNGTCTNPKCVRRIEAGDVAFVDRLTHEVLCHNCGKCERYARKKFDERRREVAAFPKE